MSDTTQAMPRILIVDDEIPARARLTTLLSDIAEQCPHQLVGEASQAQQALDRIAELRPDLVLLDVQMPGMSGIEFAAHLAQSEYASTAIIFVTAHDAYALKAFEVHALDYLLKPVRAARLAEAIARAVSLRHGTMQQKQNLQNPLQQQMAALAAALPQVRKNFSVQERGRLLLVPVVDVLYLKAEAKYVTLRTREREYLTEASLLSLEQELAERFVRVHRNALVARDAIIGVEKGALVSESESEGEGAGDKVQLQESWQVILRDIDDRLPISRRQWPLVKALVK